MISLISKDLPLPGSPNKMTPLGIETPLAFNSLECLNQLITDNNSFF